MDVPSRSQVKKAGSNLRKYLRGDLTDDDVYQAALDTMERWRRAHASPLVIANNGLRKRARSLGIQAEVTQRLKRSQTILEKLNREPSLDLSRMQDIGGCRAVVETKEDLRRLEARILKRLEPITHTDYVENPRDSGYRGIHIVVGYSERAIELQLRAQVMHEWALATERYSQLQGENLKQDGEHPIQLFLKVAADMMALREDDLPIPDEMATLHEQRRIDALRSLTGGG
ncbi:MAG TPA: RelA/SpoT domain-containing protein [Mycobacteriales bacterium]|nr:RelA/SpoT domain-containing protein [Mycobacteriales bacterium]